MTRGRAIRTVVRGRARSSIVLLAALGLAVILDTGCEAQLQAVSEPGATQVIVGSDPTGLTVEAPTWNPDQTLVYLCPEAPSQTATDLADAGTIVLAPSCHDYGAKDTRRGLATRLPFAELDAGRRTAFEASPQWYLVLVGLWPGGPTVFRTVVARVPIDPKITPGPSDPPSPRPSSSSPGAAAPSASPASAPAGSGAP